MAVEALNLLQEIQPEKVSEFRQGCQQKLPLATIILSKDELALLKKEKATVNGAAVNGAEDASGEKATNDDALVIEPPTES